MKTALLILVIVAGSLVVGYELPHEPEIVTETVTNAIYVPVERIVEVPVEVTREIIIEVPIHNEPGLYEFKNEGELRDYIRWYRNGKMVQYGVDQCEDYTYDFMRQAIADGFLVSTEIIEKKGNVWHMANAVPIGNGVYLVDISSGSIKLYALKD